MFQMRCGPMSLDLAERAIVDIWRQVETLNAGSPILACRFATSGLVDLAFEWDVLRDGEAAFSIRAPRATARHRRSGRGMRNYGGLPPRRVHGVPGPSGRSPSRSASD